jgi:hypothetical protein
MIGRGLRNLLKQPGLIRSLRSVGNGITVRDSREVGARKSWPFPAPRVGQKRHGSCENGTMPSLEQPIPCLLRLRKRCMHSLSSMPIQAHGAWPQSAPLGSGNSRKIRLIVSLTSESFAKKLALQSNPFQTSELLVPIPAPFQSECT